MKLFLDANAHQPMSKQTQDKYCQFINSDAGWGHPLSLSQPSVESNSVLESSREKIASLLGAKSSNQIIFTSTCTQACEWSISIIKELAGYKTVYSSELEHSAVKSAFNKIIKNKDYLKSSKDGIVLDNELLKDFTVCIHTHNEFGTIQDINEIKTKFLFSDMCQSIGKISIDLKNQPIDLATFGAHKFGGPAGIGILYIKDPSLWREFGYGSRFNLDRTGTPDVAGVYATAEALEETISAMPEKIANSKIFQCHIEKELESFGFKIIGKNSNRVANTTFTKAPFGDSFSWVLDLSLKGIFVGSGSACGSIHTGQSTSVESIGEDGSFIRISQNGSYGIEEAKYFIEIIKEINAGR